MSKTIDQPINLKSDLTFRNAFRFPLQNKASKRDLVRGALWLLVPFVGWILNMGHRISFVRKMQCGNEPFPSWTSYKILFKDGLITFIGMIYYCAPGLVMISTGYLQSNLLYYIIGIILFLAAVVVIPGYMTNYCYYSKASDIFKVRSVLKRTYNMGAIYWKAWYIALVALLLSFLGLLVIGIGFLFTSVWFWQVAGYCFANLFSEKYRLENTENQQEHTT